MQLLLLLLILLSVSGLCAVPLSGNYTVGGSAANFATLTEALAAINSEGQSNSVNFFLNEGTYEGAFVIARPSSEYPFAIMAVDEAEVILTNPNSTSTDNYILKINSNSKVYLGGLKFIPSGSYARSIVVMGNSDDLTFQSNTFVNAVTTSSVNNDAITFWADGSADSDNINVSLNNFQNGGYHVYTSANSSLTHYSGWNFYLNAHTGGYTAIYLKQVSDINIQGEIINNSTSGIYIEQGSGDLEIQRCDILAKTNGIYFNNGSFTASVTPQVFNNVIRMNGENVYNPNYDSDAYGIYLQSVNNVFLAHNSIDNMSYTNASAALVIYGTSLIIKNNNLVASGYGMALSQNTASGYTVEHNNLFTSYLNLTKIGNNYQNTLAAYTALAGGSNISVDPNYDSSLRTFSPWLDNYGLPCGVDSDTNNYPRDPYTPDIGAHEYTAEAGNTPLNGTVTVGVGQDYETLTALFSALNIRGVNSALWVDLCDSLYTEQMQVKAIPGSSDTNFILLRPQSRDNVVIRYSGQTANQNYLLKLNRATNVSFHYISFETQSTTYSNLVVFEGYNYYPRFLGCRFVAPNTAAGNSIVTPYGSQTPDLDVLTCNFFGNNTGISQYGNNITIGSNYFNGQVTGVNLGQPENCEISGNWFENCTGTSVQTNGGKSLRILDNHSVGSATGLYLSNLELNGTERNLIANNAIQVTNVNMHYGIALGGSGINLLNNTFYTQGTNSFGLYSYQLGSNIDIVNNIFVAEQAHAVEMSYFSPSVDKVIDYNCYYSFSTYLVRFGAYYTDLAALRTAYPDMNQHSIQINPILNSDLHTQSPWLRRVGIFREEITVDMDYEPRGELFDIGADQQTGEYGFTPLSGTYTIGSGGQYASLPDFLEELSLLGASSSITARLLPGVHAGYNNIPNFPKVSPAITLSINSLTGAVLQLDPTVSGTGSYVFNIQGADNVILQNLSMESINQQIGSYFVILSGKCDNIQIQDCTFNLGSGYNTGVYASGSINDGLIINNCHFNQGNVGLNLSGSGTSTDLFNNIRVENSSFSNCYYPITISKADNLKITRNTLTDFNSAITLNYVYGNTDIVRNKISAHNFAGTYSSSTLLSLNYLVGDPDEEIELVGNIVYSRNNNIQSLTGISMASSSNVRLYHNTISIENSYSFEYGAAYSQSNNSNITNVNNIFASLRSGYAVLSSACTDIYYGHNAYYSGGKNLISLNSTLFDPLLGMAALSDADGVFANPGVDTNGYTTASYLGNKGAVSYVTSDINYVVYGSNIPVGASFIAYQEPLSGSVYIGSDFPNLSSALEAAMKRGIYGSTGIILPSGTHSLNMELSYIPNTLQNSFSISSNSGAVITNNATGTEDNFILKLRNMRNLNLYGISFAPLNSSFSRAIVFERYNSDVLIEDCSFNVAVNSITSEASAAIFASIEPYDNLSISSCQINNFAMGIRIGGYYNNGYPANALSIADNTINNAYYGISVYYGNAPNIIDNTITSYRNRAVLMGNNKDDLLFMRNRITGSGYQAVYLYQHTAGSPTIANNYIQNGSLSGSYVLTLETAPNCKVLHNTLVNQSTNSSSYAFTQSSGATQLDLRNNICLAASGIAAYLQNMASISSLDHNLFYSNGTVQVVLNGANINSLAAWTSATGDNTAIFGNPQLVEGGYELLSNSPAINAGVAIAGFGFDIDNRLRNLPDMGCSEYDSSFLNSPVNLQISHDYLTGETVLSWNHVSGATAYKVFYATDPNATNWNFLQVSGNSARIPESSSRKFFKISAIN
jgi:hypothetical protein